MEDGAKARTEALVSNEFRRLRFDEDARVKMDALSVKRLLAVAVLYVAGWPPPVCGPMTWDGIAEAGGEDGNW